MDASTNILIIILSVVLTIFLVVAIVLGIYLIKLTKEIRQIAQTASKVADDIKGVADNVKAITAPAALATGAVTIYEKIKSQIDKKKSAKADKAEQAE
jgi:K+-transporting ATPase A subunit